MTLQATLRKKCPYLEFFWSVFSRIRTEYGKVLRISLHSVRIREYTDQKNSEFIRYYLLLLFIINLFYIGNHLNIFYKISMLQ